MYKLVFTETAHRSIKKAATRDIRKYEIIKAKIGQILQNPYQFKPLRAPLHGSRRVHIDKSFVLVYSISESQKMVTIENYDHHDNIYKK